MRKLLAMSVVLALATVASAAVITDTYPNPQGGTVVVTQTGVPSPSNPAYTTWTVNVAVSNGDYVVGWDGSFTGDLSQQNPFGTTVTLFTDNNTLFGFDPGSFLDLDSQYLYPTNSADAVNGALIGSSYEDTSELSAAFAFTGARASSFAAASTDLAQVCVVSGPLGYEGDVLVAPETGDQYVVHVAVPEPATMALLGLGGLVMARRRRR